MKIELNNHEFVSGTFDTETDELICIVSDKYTEVELCLKGGMHIPFAKIKLYSGNLLKDAKGSYNSAEKLGREIVRRFNECENKQ